MLQLLYVLKGSTSTQRKPADSKQEQHLELKTFLELKIPETVKMHCEGSACTIFRRAGEKQPLISNDEEKINIFYLSSAFRSKKILHNQTKVREGAKKVLLHHRLPPLTVCIVLRNVRQHLFCFLNCCLSAWGIHR